MLIVTHADVASILDGREAEVVALVREAYRLHEGGASVVPHSTFLRLPHDAANRIIGLPAYLGGADPAAGMKWIASFPANTRAGRQRASAAIVLNSLATGEPSALVEGSLISARRTAASAALAADLLTVDARPEGISLIGCGVINREILRFVAHVLPSLRAVTLYDRDPERARRFAADRAEDLPQLNVSIAAEAGRALSAHSLISFATTAATPYLNLAACPPGSTVLHVSLRDLYAESILECHNIVDDADHVCREGTSLHLAEQLAGDRHFIDATIGGLIADSAAGGVVLHRDPAKAAVFSPFGLGVLDIALAHFVHRSAAELGRGIDVSDFLPAGDLERSAPA